jgi:hypothetical protein
MLLGYDWGAFATPIIVAGIGAITVFYQVRQKRSNSADHANVVTELRGVREDVGELKGDVGELRTDLTDHLKFHAHGRKSA